MDWITSSEAWIALCTLTVMEVVLGVDNLVFVSILTGRLPAAQRPKAQRLGLTLALGLRLVLLFCISWVMQLTAPLFSVIGREISGKDLILLGGGLFLMWKSVTEIHRKLEGEDGENEGGGKAVTMGSVLAQIALLDLVFSLDSVITAVGMAKDVEVMVLAIVISSVVMIAFVDRICAFVESHPTVKMLALSFLLLIGTTLVAEGAGQHFPKGYVYFAMGFSVFVEALNLRLKKKGKPVRLHGPSGQV
jgi:predicted tellurium resistance membrane protein TerC